MRAIDPEDRSLEQTALRETFEEIGIKPSSVDIIGSYSTVPNYNGSIRVHPFLGMIRNPLDPSALPFNKDEVSSVFTLPIEYLINKDIREVRQFRDSKKTYPVFKVPEHIEGEGEIWGLTSYILDGKRRCVPRACTLTLSLGIFRKIIPERYS